MSPECRSASIVTDSLSATDPHLREQLSRPLIPAYITGMVRERAIQEDAITSSEVIDALLEGVKVGTSAPNPEEIKNVYAAQPEDNDIIHICPSRKVSGWYLHALAASGELKRRIDIFDASASAGTGLYVGEALRLAREGYGVEAIIKELEAFEKRTLVLSLVHDPKHLDAGGRAKVAMAKIASLLQMKVIVNPGVREEPTIVGRERKRTNAIRDMIEVIQSDGRPIEHVSFSWSPNGTNPQGSLRVVDQVAEVNTIWKALGSQRDGATRTEFELSPAAVVHLGPGNLSASVLFQNAS